MQAYLAAEVVGEMANFEIPGLDKIKDPHIRETIRLIGDILNATKEAAQGPQSGLLSAIPTRLSANEIGKVYHATDYDRLFRWNGTSWGDVPGQTPRGTVSYFPAGSTPTGWARCGGGPVRTSLANAQTKQFTPPTIANINSLIAWIRL